MAFAALAHFAQPLVRSSNEPRRITPVTVEAFVPSQLPGETVVGNSADLIATERNPARRERHKVSHRARPGVRRGSAPRSLDIRKGKDPGLDSDCL
jgi:hypothetical protein